MTEGPRALGYFPYVEPATACPKGRGAISARNKNMVRIQAPKHKHGRAQNDWQVFGKLINFVARYAGQRALKSQEPRVPGFQMWDDKDCQRTLRRKAAAVDEI